MNATNVVELRRATLPSYCSNAARSLDTVHFHGRGGAIGSFACPVAHPRFRDSGAIERAIVVFPRTSVWIQHHDSSPFVADPSVVTIYNRAQRYERKAIAADGDRCDWFAIDDQMARDIVAAFDPREADAERGPFHFESTPCPPSLYLQQRLLLRRAIARGADALELEEGVVAVVTHVLSCAYQRRNRAPLPRVATSRRHRLLAEQAKAEIARHVHENSSVRDIADAVGASVFHLCRVFRAETGMTLHAYRTDLRLRLMLDALSDARRASLSEIALSLGFASHAHLVRHCRDRLGAAPSAVRALVAGESRS